MSKMKATTGKRREGDADTLIFQLMLCCLMLRNCRLIKHSLPKFLGSLASPLHLLECYDAIPKIFARASLSIGPLLHLQLRSPGAPRQGPQRPTKEPKQWTTTSPDLTSGHRPHCRRPSVADRDVSRKAWATMLEELQVRTSVMVSVEIRRRIIIIIMPRQLGELIP